MHGSQTLSKSKISALHGMMYLKGIYNTKIRASIGIF